jgi:hypothetical protein
MSRLTRLFVFPALAALALLAPASPALAEAPPAEAPQAEAARGRTFVFGPYNTFEQAQGVEQSLRFSANAYVFKQGGLWYVRATYFSDI